MVVLSSARGILRFSKHKEFLCSKEWLPERGVVRWHVPTSFDSLKQSVPKLSRTHFLLRIAAASLLAFLMALAGPIEKIRAQSPQSNQNPSENLKQLSLE